jgi:hypothetical protein
MNKLILLFCILILATTSIYSIDHFKSNEWLSALYYEKNGSTYRSLAEEEAFFVSKFGKTSPKIEYDESLKLVEEQNIEFKTDFPYRYKLISQQNNLNYLPTVSVNQDINKALIAYPNRYMSNPASMFGHLFLVLESKRGILDSDILHYIAETDGNRGVIYMLKGLSGSYKGFFLREPFYKKIKNYNYVEDRDISYYDLKLTPAQIENLQLHYKELQKTFFYYYFIDKNCSYFIAKLLNVVIDRGVILRSPYMMPSHVINDLVDANLLDNERVRVANTKEFNRQYNKLSDLQKKEVVSLFNNKKETISGDPRVLKAFIISSEYMINNHSALADNIRFNRIEAYKILRGLNQSNVRQIIDKKKFVSKIKSTAIEMAKTYSDNYQVSLKPIYFSENDELNKLELIGVKGFSLKLNLDKKRPSRLILDFLNLLNMTEYNNVLKSFSWKLKSTFSYQNGLSSNQEFYIGISKNFMDKGLFFGLAGFSFGNFDDIYERSLTANRLLPSVDIGFNYILDKNIKTTLSYKYKYEQLYLSGSFLYKNGNLLNKVSIINSEAQTFTKFSAEYLF